MTLPTFTRGELARAADLQALADAISAAGTAGGINVKDAPYYAVGDGVTNDTAALQAAIDAAKGTGLLQRGVALLIIPAGVYLHDGLLIDKPLHIQGAGVGATVLQKRVGSTGPSIKVEISTSGFNYVAAGYPHPTVEIDDMTIYGSGASDTGAGGSAYGVQVTGASFAAPFIYLSRVTVHEHFLDGLYSTNNSGGMLRDCIFSHNGRNGALVNSHDWQFHSCLFGGNLVDGMGGYATSQLQMVSCNFYSNARFGALLQGASTAGINDNSFTGCSFDRNGLYGFFWDAAGAQDCTLTDCYFTLNAQSASSSSPAYGDIYISDASGQGLRLVNPNFWLPGDVNYSPKQQYNIRFETTATSGGTVEMTGARFRTSTTTYGDIGGAGATNQIKRVAFLDSQRGQQILGTDGLIVTASAGFRGLLVQNPAGTPLGQIKGGNSSQQNGVLQLFKSDGTVGAQIVPVALAGFSPGTLLLFPGTYADDAAAAAAGIPLQYAYRKTGGNIVWRQV